MNVNDTVIYSLVSLVAVLVFVYAALNLFVSKEEVQSEQFTYSELRSKYFSDDPNGYNLARDLALADNCRVGKLKPDSTECKSVSDANLAKKYNIKNIRKEFLESGEPTNACLDKEDFRKDVSTIGKCTLRHSKPGPEWNNDPECVPVESSAMDKRYGIKNVLVKAAAYPGGVDEFCPIRHRLIEKYSSSYKK